MSNQDWTSKLQDQLAGYQESVSHDLWAGIEQSLAQNNIESVSSNPQTIVSESSESTDLHVGSEAKRMPGFYTTVQRFKRMPGLSISSDGLRLQQPWHYWE